MSKRMQHFILKGREPVAVDLLTWARWFENIDARRVAETKIGAVRVSTVFLGLDARLYDSDGPPLLFETMIFGGAQDGEKLCAATWDDAELMHAAACALVGASIHQ